MTFHTTAFRSLLSKSLLATAVLGGFLSLAAPGAQAQGRYDCDRRVNYTDWRYHEAVEHFGRFSPEARYWAHERHEAREYSERCRHEWREHREDRGDWR